jgi:hypothetical protein
MILKDVMGKKMHEIKEQIFKRIENFDKAKTYNVWDFLTENGKDSNIRSYMGNPTIHY